MKTNVIIGHSTIDQGAIDKKSGMSEFIHGTAVGYHIITKKGHEVNIIFRNTSYSKLPAYINKFKSDLNICLHMNAANEKAEGSEVLSSGSKKSLAFANIIAEPMSELFEVNNRGIKIRAKRSRGSNVLVNTKAPTVILEPEFIDNKNDYELRPDKLISYSELICDSIDIFAEKFNV